MRRFLFRQRTESYTCLHFVAELWAHLHGESVDPIKICVNNLRSLRKIERPDPTCVVLFRQTHESPHCGILLDDGYLAHMGERYSIIVPLETVACNYNTVTYFK